MKTNHVINEQTFSNLAESNRSWQRPFDWSRLEYVAVLMYEIGENNVIWKNDQSSKCQWDRVRHCCIRYSHEGDAIAPACRLN